MADLKARILKLFLSNRQKVNGYQYTVPSPENYPYQWLWDSCFHAIILTYFNISDAKKEILALLSKQFDNGMIPHMIYWNNNKRPPYPLIGASQWGKKDTSSITQPPMIAYAVWTIFQKSSDKKFVEEVYPRLYHFYRYLLNERDPHENHLIGIMNPDESGEDNSPRFDPPLGLPSKHSFKENLKKRLQLVSRNIECKFDAPFCMRNFFWVKDISFNSLMVANLRLLAKLAGELDSRDDALYFMKEAEAVSQAMRQLMLEDGIFYSTFGADYQKIKVKTWASFTPLFAKILSFEEAEKLVYDHLLNKDEFWTNFPVPTVSLDEPSYNTQKLWRGPTWIGANWVIYKGLINYGFTDIAEQIKKTSIELLKKSGFREYFDPATGKGLGARNFTWGGLIVDMN